jgi:hypothetical protein
VLAARGLVFVTEAGQVVVTSPGAVGRDMTNRRYAVEDLATDTKSLNDLAAVIERLIAPESWKAKGGRATIRPANGVLYVEQTSPSHHEILVFCEKLRVAHGLPLRSRYPASLFAVDARRDRAAGVLNRKLTANFQSSAPLVEVLGYLGELAGADILLDRRALAAEGLSDDIPASVALADEPFASALDELLRPLGLAWRVIDERTVQVSTQAALNDHTELEFYPVGHLLDGLVTGQTLIEQIRTRIAGPTWSDAGGPGEIHFDPAAKCLIIRHNQAVQAAVERLLGEQR